MVKKGKYKLFSYIIDRYLIYYKSLNKNSKFIAFAAIETNSFNPIFLLLNDFLRQRFIHYYTIQIYAAKKEKYLIILNFEDIEKDGITKIFNIIYQKLREYENSIKFLENNKLERIFSQVFCEKINSNISITENSGSLVIRNEKRLRFLDFYRINLEYLENKISFIDTFVSLIQNYNRVGYLFFNFQINFIDQIQIYPYFVEIDNKVNYTSDIAKRINDFFNNNILKKQNAKIKKSVNYLWRLSISNDAYLLRFYYNLFISKEQYFLPLLVKFNLKFEQNLMNNKIKFTRLSNKLLLVEQTFLIVILPILESNYIKLIIKKYYLKYHIYFFLLNKPDYEKLSQIKEIDKLKNIKVILSDNISNFDLKIFKNE